MGAGDGTGAYPRAEAIERGRPPTGAKDWDDARRAQGRQQERAYERTQGRERSPEHGHGGRGRERDDTPDQRR